MESGYFPSGCPSVVGGLGNGVSPMVLSVHAVSMQHVYQGGAGGGTDLNAAAKIEEHTGNMLKCGLWLTVNDEGMHFDPISGAATRQSLISQAYGKQREAYQEVVRKLGRPMGNTVQVGVTSGPGTG